VPAMVAVTLVAGRLLGARRGWVSLTISGVIGWTGAVLCAGELTDWEWATLDMVLVALALGTVFTMAVALLLDLIAPVGSLAGGDAAGLVTVRNPVAASRQRIAPFRRYRQVLAIARREGVISRGCPTSSSRSVPGERWNQRAASSSSWARWRRRARTCCPSPGAMNCRCSAALPSRNRRRSSASS